MALVSRWKLSDASGVLAADSIGANSGEYSGSPLLNQAGIVPAYSDTCPQFDGVNDYVDLGKIIEAWTACTQKYWIKPTAKAFYQLSDFGTAPGVWLNESGEVKAEVDPSETAAVTIAASGAYSAGQVLCVHCTYAAGRFRLYVNGVKVKESTTPKGTITNTATNGGTLGANGARSGGFFNGKLARVELWNSEMSEAEVAADYAADMSVRAPAAAISASTTQPSAGIAASSSPASATAAISSPSLSVSMAFSAAAAAAGAPAPLSAVSLGSPAGEAAATAPAPAPAGTIGAPPAEATAAAPPPAIVVETPVTPVVDLPTTVSLLGAETRLTLTGASTAAVVARASSGVVVEGYAAAAAVVAGASRTGVNSLRSTPLILDHRSEVTIDA